MPRSTSESGSVKSARRVGEILSFLAASESPRSLSAASTELGIPRSSTHALLKELVASRLVERVDAIGPPTYRIGIRSFEIGSAFLRQRNLGEEGREVVARLSRVIDDTAHLATLDGPDIMYIAKAESSQSMRVVSAIGSRLPAQATATGRVQLAYLTPEELEVLLPDPLPALTAKTTTSRNDLMLSLEHVREQEWAFDDEESTPGLQCLAAPVFDHTERCVAGLSVSLPTFRMQAWDLDGLLGIVKEHSEILSSELGSRRVTSAMAAS